MPRLMDNDNEIMQTISNGSFQFSAVRPDELGASSYTLVTIVIDVSGSVFHFSDELLKTLKSIVEACKKSPMAENLLIRIVTFNHRDFIKEVHGFKLLSLIDLNDYKRFRCESVTALYNATYEAITSTLNYSKTLIDSNYDVNGAIYIITDGVDNNSDIASPESIKKEIERSAKNEIIESLLTVLIGINVSECKDDLSEFSQRAGIMKFIDAGDASPSSLAKIAGFISKSISSQSQSINTGAVSQDLTF